MTNISDFNWIWQKTWYGVPSVCKRFTIQIDDGEIEVYSQITAYVPVKGQGTKYKMYISHEANEYTEIEEVMAFSAIYQQAVYETTAILNMLRS